MTKRRSVARHLLTSVLALCALIICGPAQVISQSVQSWSSLRGEETADSDDLSSIGASAKGGIRELIPEKYKQRYREWRNEFLSAEIGRSQWEVYARNPRFTLTLTISPETRNGARTSEFRWNNSGELIAATITFGPQIDKGYPPPEYYPVINALNGHERYFIRGRVLAATKIAHEFGHVTQFVRMQRSLHLLQEQTIPIYNRILLSNGYNIRDPRLVELAQSMGGTPMEIIEDRECWAEANAMLYLCDRMKTENSQCSFLSRVKLNLESYAKGYKPRIVQIVLRNLFANCG